MKRIILFFILSTGLVLVSQAQNKDQKKNAPKEDIKVNREYDEQGNLIRFDSTYTYNWSNDSTLINQMMQEDLNKFFDDHFSVFNDSSFFGSSFFGDFDQLFSGPFSNKRDSLMMKKFGLDQFHSHHFGNDSVPISAKDLDELFGQMKPGKTDSISSKSPSRPLGASPRTIEDMMKMMQRQMQEMEEMQRRFFQQQSNRKNEQNLKKL